MKDKTKGIMIGVFLLCALALCLFDLIQNLPETETEIVSERHYISMKWIVEQLLDTDYYFEFDNTTSFLIDGEFSNPSYIYHKYEIGDIINYNVTRYVK